MSNYLQNAPNSSLALFGFPGRISVRREVPDAAVDDEGIALAIAEEANAADGRLAADRKLREKSNKAFFPITKKGPKKARGLDLKEFLC